jgi:hypothetical protein
MAEFTADVYQNEFLPDGATDVSAIVTVTCSGAGTAGQSDEGDAAEVVILDVSGSMGTAKFEAALRAASVALDQVVDGTWFGVVVGNHEAWLAYPAPTSEQGLVRMSAATRAEAKAALRLLRPNGGSAMGTWLKMAVRVFNSVPGLSQKHAILLTDGKNQHETPAALDQAVAEARGVFQCDCRGIGADWEVGEVRRMANALLGTVDLIPGPESMEAEFEALMRTSMGRGVAAADLRVWAPQGAQVLFVRQVSPSVEDLTSRRQVVNPLTGGYPTGAWGDESRDYHVGIRLAPKGIGMEQLAARVQLAVNDAVVAQGLVKALWSDNEELTAKINPAVAHYTGQTELADAIQEGLAAKAAGDEATATAKLGRAVQLAAETGNDEATSKLRKVVEIDDEKVGTVRLKAAVAKADEMALDTASTKTTRIKK